MVFTTDGGPDTVTLYGVTVELVIFMPSGSVPVKLALTGTSFVIVSCTRVVRTSTFCGSKERSSMSTPSRPTATGAAVVWKDSLRSLTSTGTSILEMASRRVAAPVTLTSEGISIVLLMAMSCAGLPSTRAVSGMIFSRWTSTKRETMRGLMSTTSPWGKNALTSTVCGPTDNLAKFT